MLNRRIGITPTLSHWFRFRYESSVRRFIGYILVLLYIAVVLTACHASFFQLLFCCPDYWMRRVNRFRDLKDEYDALDCVVLGVSADHETSHGKFIAKFSLNFSLLADTNRYLSLGSYAVIWSFSSSFKTSSLLFTTSQGCWKPFLACLCVVSSVLHPLKEAVFHDQIINHFILFFSQRARTNWMCKSTLLVEVAGQISTAIFCLCE